MSDLPVMTKTWYTQANVPMHASASIQDTAKSIWFNLKTLLCNQNTSGTLSTTTGTRPSSSAWQVVSSSNGVSHGATDYWGTVYNSTNFVSAAYNASHSWCILKNTTNGYHMLIDLNSATATTGRISFASGAIAGGALTSPAATSETWIMGSTSDNNTTTTAYIGDTVVGAGQHYIHFSTNENGEFHVLISRQGQNIFHSFLCFQRLSGSHSSDNRNYFTTYDQVTSGRGAPRALSLGGSTAYAMRRNQFGSLMTAGGFNNPMDFGNADAASYGIDTLKNKYNTWQFQHMCLAPNIHYNGVWPDFYVCQIATNCASLPSTSAQQWVLANNILVPMIDVVPLT